MIMMRMIASKPYVLRTLIHGVSGKFVPHLFVVSTPFWSTGKDRQLWWLGQDVKNFTQDQHQHLQLETQELPVQEEDRPPMPSTTSSPSASASLNLLSHSCFHFPRWLFWARSWSEASEGCRLSFILRRRSKRWIWDAPLHRHLVTFAPPRNWELFVSHCYLGFISRCLHCTMAQAIEIKAIKVFKSTKLIQAHFLIKPGANGVEITEIIVKWMI